MRILAAFFWIGFTACAASADDSVAASGPDADVQAAVTAFQDWTKAFMEERYSDQWGLVHDRIQTWYPKKRWRRMMSRSVRKNGRLIEARITKASRVTPEELPCTEMGHCYRRGMTLVVLLLATQYETASPAQPEYVIMTKGDRGWYFGGGTFPGLPAGETIVILDRKDERRYRANVDEIQ